MFENCVILFGGVSEERMVSVASAQNLSQKIPEASLAFIATDGHIYNISADDLKNHANPFTSEFTPKSQSVSSNLKNHIPQLKNKIVILALHGTEGEDGQIQKLFEDNKIPYTGSNSVSSANAFNKIMTKKIAREAKIALAEECLVTSADDENLKKLNNFFSKHKKIVLKPNANGSSVGLKICENEKDFKTAWEEISTVNVFPYLAEAFMTGREITVGVANDLSNKVYALPCSEVKLKDDRQFDYAGKYLGNGVQELTPAPITAEEARQCQDLAIKVHQLLKCEGYSRTDMILTPRGPFLLEINTLPGLSKASFIPQQLHAIDEDLRSFFQTQIALAKKRLR